MTNRHMKTRSTLLIIREMQIRTILRYHHTLLRMAIIKKSANNKARQSVEKRELSNTVGENIDGAATMENSMEVP